MTINERLDFFMLLRFSNFFCLSLSSPIQELGCDYYSKEVFHHIGTASTCVVVCIIITDLTGANLMKCVNKMEMLDGFGIVFDHVNDNGKVFITLTILIHLLRRIHHHLDWGHLSGASIDGGWV